MVRSKTFRRVTLGVTHSPVMEGDVALGMIHYGEQAENWKFFGSAGGPFTRFDNIDIGQVDGVIGYFYNSAYIQPIREAIRQAGIPAVNISSADENIPLPRVGQNEEAVGRMGAEHLLQRGFHQFGFIKQGDTWYSQRRFDGFRQVIDQNARHTVHLFTSARERDQFKPAPIRRWLAQLPRPIAIMAATDFLGRHVIELATGMGLRVPDDVAVLGVDNNKWENALSATPMSSIEHDLWQIGYRAAELLDQLMDGHPPPAQAQWIAPIGVVSRQSTDIVLTEDPLVGRALAYIRDHCADGINVEDMLDELGVSRRNLEMQMKRATGQSPKNAISRARVERAKQMLVNSAASMEQIARSCGYERPNRFFIVFKRITGMTPGQYRHRFGSRRLSAR